MTNPETSALESALREVMRDHGLKLEEVTYRRNFKKRTVALGLKVSGNLDEQLALGLVEGAGS